MAIPHLRLWNLDDPPLYRAVVRVQGNGDLDDEAVPFGIREFRFDPETGFWLNGKNSTAVTGLQ